MNILKHIILYILISSIVWADVKVTDVSVKPRWPWNGLVDITYSIECDERDEKDRPKKVYVDFIGFDNVRNQKVAMRTLTGDGAKSAVKHGGPYTVTWDAGRDCPNMHSAAFSVKIDALVGFGAYMVVDLSGGPNTGSYPVRYTNQLPDLSDNTCRTTELWLRLIPPGTFTMGSPSNEVARYDGYDMAERQVTITQMFYIGVFECTQRQWELVMENKPSYFYNITYYATRPVEQVSYNNIRGAGIRAGAGWPTYGHKVDSNSFMGKLQEKTGLTFDLPTEAQWEYACRAGTTTALNSGKNLTNTEQDAAMNEVGRYWYNGGSDYSQNCSPTYGTARMGSYLQNAWGLYDMHGNVWEWTLDWWGASTSSSTDETNPIGPNTGSYRVIRGGSWDSGAYNCRSASRVTGNPSNISSHVGFRVLCLPLD